MREPAGRFTASDATLGITNPCSVHMEASGQQI